MVALPRRADSTAEYEAERTSDHAGGEDDREKDEDPARRVAAVVEAARDPGPGIGRGGEPARYECEERDAILDRRPALRIELGQNDLLPDRERRERESGSSRTTIPHISRAALPMAARREQDIR